MSDSPVPVTERSHGREVLAGPTIGQTPIRSSVAPIGAPWTSMSRSASSALAKLDLNNRTQIALPAHDADLPT